MSIQLLTSMSIRSRTASTNKKPNIRRLCETNYACPAEKCCSCTTCHFTCIELGNFLKRLRLISEV